ncbi:ATP-dependent (S)-NAD(P)H-hydrate dehydratase [Acrasis kona]|uniref:ATP-dependent (S)-NAD(P)H-hydrate dehydratase n=1 Tax=Acrasis kona TaxID=1008807 RepID=A0AAW2ZP11_9EUKA
MNNKIRDIVYKKIIPSGQAGRVCIIGGCREYTGAPYYAAVSSLKTGCDLSWVMCSSKATEIKTYTPEIIVLPMLSEDDLKNDEEKSIMKEFDTMLGRLHVLVIGPGLGRNKTLLSLVEKMIKAAREKNVPLVIDGDGLFLVSQNLDIIKGYKRAILTPNPNEFKKLCESVFSEQELKDQDPEDQKQQEKLIRDLCDKLGNVTVVRKGGKDIICSGKSDEHYLTCEVEGSPRRCGGQGDVLAGAMGTFLHWSIQASENDEALDERVAILHGAYGACALARSCGRAAFGKLKRGTTTPDIIEKIPEVFESLYPHQE